MRKCTQYREEGDILGCTPPRLMTHSQTRVHFRERPFDIYRGGRRIGEKKFASDFLSKKVCFWTVIYKIITYNMVIFVLKVLLCNAGKKFASRIISAPAPQISNGHSLTNMSTFSLSVLVHPFTKPKKADWVNNSFYTLVSSPTFIQYWKIPFV